MSTQDYYQQSIPQNCYQQSIPQDYYQQSIPQDYYQQSIPQDYYQQYNPQNYQQPCSMQNCQGENESQVKEFTFLKELLFLIYHCITFGNFELDEIKCSWIVTIFSNIIIAILIAVIDVVIDKKVKTNYQFCYKILKYLIILILSGIVKIFLFVPLHFVNAFAITPYLIFKEFNNFLILCYVFKYFDIEASYFIMAIIIYITIALSFISFIRIILKTHKILSMKRFVVSIILSLVVCIVELLALFLIFG